MIVLSALAALFLLPTHAHAHHCKPGTNCVKLKEGFKGCKPKTDNDYPSRSYCEIRRAARHYGQSHGFMRYLANCESRFRWWVYNSAGSGAAGLFQFMPSTFDTTPYGHRAVLHPKWNALGAGWMLSKGRRGEWAC